VKITVLVPTWRRPHCLERCLEALERQKRSPDAVIVVVREEDEPTWELLESKGLRSSRVRTVTVAEQGSGAALESGLLAASAEVVAITDDDAAPRPDWLARIENHFVADPKLGGLGGRDWLHPPLSEAGQETVGKLQWYGRLIGNHHLGAGGPREVDFVKGANMSFRLSALADAPVDERLKGTGVQMHTELDLSFAVKQRGWRLVYDPEVAVDHYPAERIGDDVREPVATTALQNSVHNETYLLLKWLPWWKKVVVLTYWLGVGSRVAPGLLLLVERWLREADRSALIRRFRLVQRGRLEGIRTFVRAWRGPRAPRETCLAR
jgi:cellulose synthase/poly-beta-1,6-N-acetylglucosamine synthase-like glycosyltransferase